MKGRHNSKTITRAEFVRTLKLKESTINRRKFKVLLCRNEFISRNMFYCEQKLQPTSTSTMASEIHLKPSSTRQHSDVVV